MCINTLLCGGTSRKEHEANSCVFTKDRLRIICENKRPPDVSLILGRDLQTRTRWRLIPARKQHNSSLLSFPFHPNSCPIPVIFNWQQEQLFFWILSDHLKLEDWDPQPPRDVSSLKSWESYSSALYPITYGYKSVLSTLCPLSLQTALCTIVFAGSGDNY